MEQLSILENHITSGELLPNVLQALKSIRVNVIREEYNLQNEIERILKDHAIPFNREYKLAPKNRIDFLVESGIGIEIKKGKPNRDKVIEQMTRYSAFNQIRILILVIERSLDIPEELNGKKCISFGLNKLWGVALK